MCKFKQIKFKQIEAGSSPLCIVGAGFQEAMLKSPLPSSKGIISKSVKDNGGEFPVLKKLSEKLDECLILAYVCQNIKPLSRMLVCRCDDIFSDYGNDGLEKFQHVIEYLVRHNQSPEDIIATLLDLEVKKAISFWYNPDNYLKKPDRPAWNERPKKTINTLLGLSNRFTWVSLNYDIVLEALLLCLANESEFNERSKTLQYCFTSLLTGKQHANTSCHTIIKPHGSLNVVFQTNRENNKQYHDVCFQNSSDFMKTFPYSEYGYSSAGDYTEKRALIIPYVQDYMKDEHNSPGVFSDLAHDFCKYNLSAMSYAIKHATSIIILGYSMPEEDKFVWERIKNRRDRRDIPIYIASGNNSNKIKNDFGQLGSRKAFILNNGFI